MKVALYTRKVAKKNVPFILDVLNHFEHVGWSPILEEGLYSVLVKKFGLTKQYDTFSSFIDFQSGIDLLVSLGGDGTFLKSATYVRNSGVPVMGINTGRLGFLANTNESELEKVCQMVINKQYDLQERSLLEVQTEGDIFGDNNFALNELALHKKDTSSMITVHASLGDNYLNSYWADGLLVATPTGSTAYSLSCGGPIVTPGCAVHILSPIAPHNLNVRPVVVPDNLPVKLSVEGRERKYLLTLDSLSKPIKNGEEVIVQKADFMINVLQFEDNNFLDTIRTKMMWGKDKRN